MPPPTTDCTGGGGLYADRPTFLHSEVSFTCKGTVETMLMFVILLKKMFRLVCFVRKFHEIGSVLDNLKGVDGCKRRLITDETCQQG
jgi:hypothetical protein